MVLVDASTLSQRGLCPGLFALPAVPGFDLTGLRSRGREACHVSVFSVKIRRQQEAGTSLARLPNPAGERGLRLSALFAGLPSGLP